MLGVFFNDILSILIHIEINSSKEIFFNFPNDTYALKLLRYHKNLCYFMTFDSIKSLPCMLQ